MKVNSNSLIKNWVFSTLRSNVIKNIFSLYIIHFANYLLPLIVVPYLVRVLSPSGFGIVSFAQSLIAYLTIFVDYGFALSATRKISVYRNNKIEVSRIFFNVLAAKGFLGLIGFIVLLLLTSLIPQFKEISTLLIILYGTIVGNILFPIWLFQGLEKMVFISVINLTTKILMVMGIFLFVKSSQDYLLYAIILSVSSMFAGFIGIILALWRFKIDFTMPSLQGIWKELKDGWILFLSMASVSLYTAGNPLILGLLTNNHTIVGYYSAAERIVKAILGLLGPISQAVYPRFSKMAAESKDLALQWGKRMLVLMGCIGFFLSFVIFLSSPLIVRLILGSDYIPSIAVMQILAWLCFLIAVSNVLGIQIMLPFGRDKAFTSIIFGAGVINVILAVLLVPTWYELGMALSVLISELFVTAAMFIYLTLNQLNPLKTIAKEVKQ